MLQQVLVLWPGACFAVLLEHALTRRSALLLPYRTRIGLHAHGSSPPCQNDMQVRKLASAQQQVQQAQLPHQRTATLVPTPAGQCSCLYEVNHMLQARAAPHRIPRASAVRPSATCMTWAPALQRGQRDGAAAGGGGTAAGLRRGGHVLGRGGGSTQWHGASAACIAGPPLQL